MKSINACFNQPNPMGIMMGRRQLCFAFVAGISACVVAPSVCSDAFAADDAKPKILIIKPDAEDESYAFIHKALAPSRRDAMFDITVALPNYLAEQPLAGFATIFLNDVAKLSDPQNVALQKAVAGGAGLCCFFGKHADVDHYNRQCYAGGKGWLPLPLGQPTDLPEGKTGISAAKHPALNVFAGDGQAMLDIVLVTRSHVPAANWNAREDKALSVIARSENGNLIAASKPFGDGQVAVFLFAPDRRWANWHFYPAWVVMMHELQTFLTEY